MRDVASRSKSRQDYRLRALDCERAAQATYDPYERSLLLLTASRWHTFADYYDVSL
jgi:hypothetical protein